MAIPLSRFQKFLTNAVISAVNARITLMQTEDVPIKTSAFTLNLSGEIIDDVGGVGWNEIERITKNNSPETIVETVVVDPASETVTSTDPEHTITTQKSSDNEKAISEGENTASESSSQKSTDIAKEKSNDTGKQVTQQEFGKKSKTTNQYNGTTNQYNG